LKQKQLPFRDCIGLLSAPPWEDGTLILRAPTEGPKGVRWRIALKKSMIALLAGFLLLSAAMPAFAHRHHRHHHHHDTIVVRP
jgi:hypothetical protein